MRVSPVVVLAALGCVACARPNAAGYPAAPSMNETISISGSPVTIRALEGDLKAAIRDRRTEGNVGLGFNESGGPPPRTMEASSSILDAAFEDARRKARALAGAVHGTLGAPLAVDEVNAADASPRYGGGPSVFRGPTLNAAVMVNRDGPEIVRVTFALRAAGGPTSTTVYGLAVPTTPPIAPATQLSVNLQAFGDDALSTIAAWENRVRTTARRAGARDSDIRIQNVNANFPPSRR